MTFILPGLFDFTTGVSSAIEQNTGRLANENRVTSNYLDTLNAFNASLNTNDNLELRRGFAEQPAGTSILDRFGNFAQSSTNPFAVSHALTAQQSLAPLTALATLQNPFFGQQQGIPLQAQTQVSRGFFQANPLLQQQFNQQLQPFLNQGNPGLDPATLAQLQVGKAQLAQQNDLQQQNIQLTREVEELRRALQSNAGQPTDSTQTQSSSQVQRAPKPKPKPILSHNRQGTLGPAPIVGGSSATAGANSRGASQ